MKKLNIEITKAALTGFEVQFQENGTPHVTASLMLMTEQGKEVTTHQLRTNAWRDEDKFTLPIVMIDPIQRIAAALEEVVVNHLRDGQLALGTPAVEEEVSVPLESEGDIEYVIDDFLEEESLAVKEEYGEWVPDEGEPTELQPFYITMGQVHVHKIPYATTDGEGVFVDKDTVVEVWATSKNHAHWMALKLFGRKFAFVYDEMPDMELFPKGIVQLSV